RVTCLNASAGAFLSAGADGSGGATATRARDTTKKMTYFMARPPNYTLYCGERFARQAKSPCRCNGPRFAETDSHASSDSQGRDRVLAGCLGKCFPFRVQSYLKIRGAIRMLAPSPTPYPRSGGDREMP